jgi:hypothetical protein
VEAMGMEARNVLFFVMDQYVQMNSTQQIYVVGSGHAGLVARAMIYNQSTTIISGITLIDSLSEYDPRILGGALDLTPEEYIERVAAPLVAEYKLQHYTANVGACLFNYLPIKNRFPKLNETFRSLQQRERCNGGQQAMASMSAAQEMYSNLLNATLGDIPLLVLASGGLFDGSAYGAALKEVQQLLYGLSTGSTIQIFENSMDPGDLVVQHVEGVGSAILEWLRG